MLRREAAVLAQGGMYKEAEEIATRGIEMLKENLAGARNNARSDIRIMG